MWLYRKAIVTCFIELTKPYEIKCSYCEVNFLWASEEISSPV